jgi:hypothetical protein
MGNLLKAHIYVRYWGYFGRQMLAASISHFDPKRTKIDFNDIDPVRTLRASHDTVTGQAARVSEAQAMRTYLGC